MVQWVLQNLSAESDDMSAPLESPEFTDTNPDTPDGLYVGNTKDDDGPVIDSFFIETDAPATPVVEPVKAEPLVEPTPITRLFTGTEILAVGGGPYMLLPPDKNRKSLKLALAVPSGTATATDYLNIADNQGAVSYAQNTGGGAGVTRIRPYAFDWAFDGHTGAVWISSGLNQTLPLELSWAVVTI